MLDTPSPRGIDDLLAEIGKLLQQPEIRPFLSARKGEIVISWQDFHVTYLSPSANLKVGVDLNPRRKTKSDE